MSKTLNMAYSALGAVFIAICSWISIPTTIPFTMQTFAVFLVLSYLGGRRGTAAIAVYIAMGAVGIPVFAGFGSGIGIIFGATGGYIAGFLLAGLIYCLAEKLAPPHTNAHGAMTTRNKILALLAGLFVCYAFGTAWFMLFCAGSGSAVGLASALSMCVVPFIVPDLVKLFLAVTLSHAMPRR